MKKKVLITGVTGFAGSFLAEHLESQNKYEITGTYLTENSLDSISSIKNSITLYQLNLIEREKVFEIISKVKPDLIFHLAAFSATAESFENPAEVITTNISSQANILDALLHNNLLNSKTLIISSAEVYGIVKKENLPIDENTPLRPVNPYAVSKVAQDFMGLQYFLSYNLPIVRVRPFNHIGPRQSPSFVVSAFCKKIAEIEKEIRPPILTVGNLESTRDFTDARDIAIAYELAIEKGISGDVYNLGSGTSYKISEILDMLLSFSKKEIKVEIDPSLVRNNDVNDFLCNYSKFAQLTGWKPKIPIETSLKDTLNYWRSSI